MQRRHLKCSFASSRFALIVPALPRARDVLQARMSQSERGVPTTVSDQGQVTVDGEPFISPA